MLDDITASPLCWPHWRPRTEHHKRKCAKFGKRNEKGYGLRQLTLNQATTRLIEQIKAFTPNGKTWRCNPDLVIISCDLQLRKSDGMPRSGQRTPDDPGVAVYFELDGVDRCIPCDTYLRIEDNIAAVADTLDALRRIERHGSQMFEQAFTGFNALPSPSMVVGRNWRDVMNYYGDDYYECRQAFMRLRSKLNPDMGGDDNEFDQLLKAWEQAKQHFQPT